MENLQIIKKMIQNIWNTQKNIVLQKHYLCDEKQYTLDISIISNDPKIIVRYDEYLNVYEDATDLYIHAIREEFEQLHHAIEFIAQKQNINDLYQLFELNYGRRLKKLLKTSENKSV